MNKKILNMSLIVIVLLILVSFSALFIVFYGNSKASNSVYDDINNKPTNLIPEIDESKLITDNVEEDTSSVSSTALEYNAEKLMPFTGAFPNVDMIPFLSTKEDIKEFSNEQILQLGFSKVTKNDWEASYVGEGEIVSIEAELLDGYIKDIFGENVQYEKTNFSNTNYSIDKDFKSHTSSYEVTYVPETDTYNIEHTVGDGIDENYISVFEPTTSRIQGKVEIEIPYVFVVYGDKMATKTMEDGTEAEGFQYTVYANCNYETKTFTDEFGSFTEFDDLANEDGIFSMYEVVKNFAQKDLSKVKKMTLIYEPNEDETEYVLKEIKR